MKHFWKLSEIGDLLGWKGADGFPLRSKVARELRKAGVPLRGSVGERSAFRVASDDLAYHAKDIWLAMKKELILRAEEEVRKREEIDALCKKISLLEEHVRRSRG